MIGKVIRQNVRTGIRAQAGGRQLQIAVHRPQDRAHVDDHERHREGRVGQHHARDRARQPRERVEREEPDRDDDHRDDQRAEDERVREASCPGSGRARSRARRACRGSSTGPRSASRPGREFTKPRDHCGSSSILLYHCIENPSRRPGQDLRLREAHRDDDEHRPHQEYHRGTPSASEREAARGAPANRPRPSPTPRPVRRTRPARGSRATRGTARPGRRRSSTSAIALARPQSSCCWTRVAMNALIIVSRGEPRSAGVM